MARILYLSQSYVPSRRADAIQVMRMCEALAGLGHDVELITKSCPARTEPGVHDDYAFYGVSRTFEIEKLPRPAAIGGGLYYTGAQVLHALRRRSVVDLVLSREVTLARVAVAMGVPTVFEAHGVPRGRLALAAARGLLRARSFRRLVVISHGLRTDLAAAGLAPEGRTLVAPDAADLGFVEKVSRLRRSPSASERPRVGYVGHLYPGRGIELISALASRMPGVDFEIVGGHDQAVASWRHRAGQGNLTFRGFVEPAQLPAIYAGFQVLLMPYQRKVGVESGRTDTARWMSPVKMFEYMATGVPILASDLDVLGEVLEHDRNSLLADPEDVAEWRRAIEELLESPRLARRLGAEARADIEREHSWQRRAEKIVGGIL